MIPSPISPLPAFDARARCRSFRHSIAVTLQNLRTLCDEAEQMVDAAECEGFDARRLLERLRIAEVGIRVAVEGAAEEAGLVGV